MSRDPESKLLTVFTHCYDDLKAFIARRFGCALLADDVVQETWLRVQRISPLQTIKQPRAYLFRIASNLATDQLRSEQSRRHYISDEPVPESLVSDMPSPETVLDYQQRLIILQQAIEELPPRCREVFLLHKFKNMSHTEIAKQLNISRNMVEKHVIRALTHCRNHLQQALQ
ncbi:RNA polymerase sigma factor [Methylophaga sp. OBS4]|uniref:RNA polymerase sigma factor n=1 Tax=Methylophaga sp. OBS4 TaxID=2991935 RepID=UPI00224D418D|nr:sigma-70 family RNA polymerase sigma factor [Methylophaga sp. OBS4]MCX4188159.1 sigma-70 family RNA polymerase sigma factor [Methylophaga sp. OBS4]